MSNCKLILFALVLAISFQQIVGTADHVSLQELSKNVEVEEDLKHELHIFDFLFGQTDLRGSSDYEDLADLSDIASALQIAFERDDQFNFEDIEDQIERIIDDNQINFSQVFDHVDVTEGDIFDALALASIRGIESTADFTGEKHYLTSFLFAAIDELDKLDLDVVPELHENYQYPFELDKEIIVLDDEETYGKQDSLFAAYPAITWIVIAIIVSALCAIGVKTLGKSQQSQVPEEEGIRYYQI